MFDRLFPRRAPEPKPLPQPNAQLALGALLVRVAFADRNYRATEIGQIDRILARTFDIGPIEAAKLRATAEALERDAPETPEFARILREEVDYAHRLALGEAMWSVALSDGHRHEKEEIQLLAIETALGLTDQDIEDLHERAMRTL
ncbi:TerB family tellurite resistance protein [Sulfitobacter sp. M57]|uniref:tellurite resistance TerB family protein n=1 Tax=unclassified Sulfitobacter TaxID=196795 RepID=UPI0023E2C270|nr:MULTISPECIES: TerB family tellurite resistance protein [unclassified Sulfitobacter]MDF3414251.1 TerB family tellurite resistance protein [Sulfitobacter sp. KE5]MDF3420467.1 TerB family tellurite resistance protein [Sulfitobacter sp. KE43]MDF3432797.1 TerB family tellurite resistance protein [Sulfitobacter sp. KE42]MDF3458437.1 TerB family tellurite resistance protein [Sulfitobacter sp. S74]MDF3462337.1 TerB family tellurite resistance protein [Sulfitobacter sp. Ks18]